MKNYKLITLLLLFCTQGMAAENSSALQNVTTTDAPKSSGPYSQGMMVDLRQGKLLYISGQSEDDPSGKLHNKSMADATNQTLNNIEAILKAAGTSWENVVRVDVYLQDINDWTEMNKVYKKRFPKGIFPARVAVQALNGSRLEIACTAFVPDRK